MGAMNALPRSVPLTYDDLQAMPDDGHRYELVDGVLIVTPAPRILHQRAVVNLLALLHGAIPTDMEVFVAPVDYVVSPLTVLQPDLLVARRDEVGERNLQHPPVLVVEILSPSTRRIDAGTKRLAFEGAGVPHYWMVDPDEPSILALELVGGAYRETARVAAGDTFVATTPFPIRIVPAALVE
jgi:Uma2 family endonuclease